VKRNAGEIEKYGIVKKQQWRKKQLEKMIPKQYSTDVSDLRSAVFSLHAAEQRPLREVLGLVGKFAAEEAVYRPEVALDELVTRLGVALAPPHQQGLVRLLPPRQRNAS
ncbi:MAG: hypothetical protein AAF721_05105, partial [Myxococcota bacterium]